MKAPQDSGGQWTVAQVETIIQSGIAAAILCGYRRGEGESDQAFFQRAYKDPATAAMMQKAGEIAFATLGESS